jgi:hypothetical protein
MMDPTSLPALRAPRALRERALRRALSPAPRPQLPKALADAALVAFCLAHLGWCLRSIGWI